MNKLITLTGAANGHDAPTEEVLARIVNAGAFRASIVGRELSVETSQKELDDIKFALKTLGIREIKIRESRKLEITVSRVGKGTDPKGAVEVSIMPATRLTGLKLLDVVYSNGFSADKAHDDIVREYPAVVREVMNNAGVTDALFTVKLVKNVKDINTALEMAAIESLIDAEGLVQI